MEIHTSTHQLDVCLEREPQKHFSDISHKMVLLIRVSIENVPVNISGIIVSIMSKTTRTLIIQV